jgi:hypothetical protein
MKRIFERQTHLLRLRANRLSITGAMRSETALEAVRAVMAVQAQDLPAGRLSLRPRSHHLTAEDVETSRQADRQIIWAWCLRGTLHLLAVEDFRWLLPLLSPGLLAGHARRFRQLGWDDENSRAGLGLLREALESQEALSRLEIASLLKSRQLPYAGQATPHLIFRGAILGWLCNGPMRGSKPTYVATSSWIGDLQPLPRPEALSRLALRYLQAYAPARPEDLAAWSGLKVAEARQAWESLEKMLVPVEYAGQACWMLESQLSWLDEPEPAEPVVNLLPRFDTFLMGYASRDFCVPREHARQVHPGGGILHAVLLVDGLAQATWVMQSRKDRLEVTLQPFEPLPEALRPLIQAEAEDTARFLGMKGEVEVRFAV